MIITPLTNRLPAEWLPGVEKLTRAERRVVNLMLSGMTIREVSEYLKASRESITWHTRGIYKKLNVSSQNQLYALVIESLMPVDRKVSA